MTTTSDFYVKQAIQCEQDAAATALENVRERCLRSARTWRALAERLTRAETMRVHEAEEKAAARQEGLEPGPEED